jgi:hypothetical protein
VTLYIGSKFTVFGKVKFDNRQVESINRNVSLKVKTTVKSEGSIGTSNGRKTAHCIQHKKTGYTTTPV